LIHHFDRTPLCKRAWPELCRIPNNAEVPVQVFPTSNLFFIDICAVHIGCHNFDSSHHDDSIDYSYSMEQAEEDPPLFHDLTPRLLLDEDSDITDEEAIGSDSDESVLHTFAMPSGMFFFNTDSPTTSIGGVFTFTSDCPTTEMPSSLNALATEVNLLPAEESILALVVENCLPISLYNKILDWARYVHLTEYNFSAAPIYVTALRQHMRPSYE
jgi:hypothetical protein